MLLSLRRQLIDRLTSEFKSWSVPPLHASLFGSAARKDGSTKSDIDLFIVRPDGTNSEDGQWRAQLDCLPQLIFNWTGNHAGIAEVEKEEFYSSSVSAHPLQRN